MKNDKNKLFTVGIVIVVIIVVAIGIIVGKNIIKITEDEENSDDYKLTTREGTYVVTDANDFYTATGCVRKYLTAAYGKDPNELVQLLSEDYKQKNKITKENVLEKVKTYQASNVFEPKRIYEKEISNTIKRYYVFGTIKEDLFETVTTPVDYYIVLDLDYEINRFAVSFDDILDESTIK